MGRKVCGVGRYGDKPLWGWVEMEVSSAQMGGAEG